MGKHKKVIVQTGKVEENLEIEHLDSISERYRPFLIHAYTYSILTDEILTLMPSQRNVLLSMNEYDLYKINPTHPNNSDSPTHLILFCIRFIADDRFQPIGGLLIYKQIDQSAILAECVKAYINDLWKLNLHVVATVSPPLKIFKDILGHLTTNKDFDKNAEAISYSVHPIKEIIHIYDIQFLIISLQNLLQEGDIIFRCQYKANKVFTACWKDICVVMNTAPEFKLISEFISSKEENIQRRVHIFTQQIFVKYLEVRDRGLLSMHDGGCLELLSAVRSFLIFFEFDFVYPPEYSTLNWSNLIHILSTMTFQKTEKNILSENVSKNVSFSKEKLNHTKSTKEKKKNKKNNNSDLKNDVTSVKNEDLYKDFLAANEGLSSIYELCEVLRKTKSFGEDTEEMQTMKIGTNPKTDNFDLEISLRKMGCDISLMNYTAKEVVTEGKNIDEGRKDLKGDRIIHIKRKDENTFLSKDKGNKEKTENGIKNLRTYEKKYVVNKKEPPDYNVNLVENSITKELICTVKGIKQLMALMAERRVKQIKPDALIVEHIDYLVNTIQTSINHVNNVYYYGHAYSLMNPALAYATLSNTKGLYLVSKD